MSLRVFCACGIAVLRTLRLEHRRPLWSRVPGNLVRARQRFLGTATNFFLVAAELIAGIERMKTLLAIICAANILFDLHGTVGKS